MIAPGLDFLLDLPALTDLFLFGGDDETVWYFGPSGPYAAVFGFGSIAASANSMTWHVRSESSSTVHLQFYSQQARVALEHQGLRHRRRLDARLPAALRSGEKVCYGAWVKNHSSSYWGSGYDGEQVVQFVLLHLWWRPASDDGPEPLGRTPVKDSMAAPDLAA